MEKKNINSLKDIHREKEKLRISLKESRQQAERQFEITKKDLSRFLLTRVALPMGAVGAATAFGISKMRSNGKESSSKNAGKSLLSLLTPVVLQILKVSSKLLKK